MTTQVTKETIRNERIPGRGIPETVMYYIAMNADRFQSYCSHEKDTERFLRTSKKGLAREDAEQLAWLCWNARMVQGWTRSNGVVTVPWDMAVLHAWERSELFKTCAAKRKAYYAEQKARAERLEGAFDASEGASHEAQARDEHDSTKAAELQAQQTAEHAAE